MISRRQVLWLMVLAGVNAGCATFPATLWWIRALNMAFAVLLGLFVLVASIRGEQ